jgi:phage terminase small subunit
MKKRKYLKTVVSNQSQLELTRMKLWCDVYIAYVSAANAVKEDGAYIWADIALKRFDEKFKKDK